MKTETIESKRTPGDWTVRPDDLGRFYDVVSGGHLLAEVKDEANASYIVNAVNCHQDLLNALRQVKLHLDYIADETKRTWKSSDQNLYDWVSTAIAKAERED